MPVVAVAEQIDKRSATLDEKFTREYHREWKVVVNDKNDGPLAVLSAPGIPLLYSGFVCGSDVDLAALLQKLNCKQSSGDWQLWEVTADYSNKLPTGGGQQQDENPLARPPEVSFGFAQFTRPMGFNSHDILHNPCKVVNAAGEYFDPLPEIDDSRPTISIARNELTFDAQKAIEYQDAVNSDDWYGYKPRQAKVRSISATRQYEAGFVFWRVSYEIHLRKEKWDIIVVQAGLRQKVSGKLIPILDDAKRVVTKPWPLKSDGTRMPTAQIEAGGGPNFKTFRHYDELPFSALNL